MAGCQWKGGKTSSVIQVKAWFRHNDPESRREVHHTNPDINKALTPYNFSYRGLGYDELCQAFDDRMAAVDIGRQSTGKNARVVLQSVLVYLPAGLADADMDTKSRWFRRAGDILDAKYGCDFLDMQVDMDEVHEYPDAETGEQKISREHGHARLFPEVDGKLNGKAFSSRKAINDLNADLHAMSEAEFGVPYMDGSKRKGGKKVEQLKVESEAAAIRAKAQEEAQKAAQRLLEDAQAQARVIIAQAEAKAEETAQEAAQEAGQMVQEAAGSVMADMEAAAAVLDDCRQLWATQEERERAAALEAKRRKLVAAARDRLGELSETGPDDGLSL